MIEKILNWLRHFIAQDLIDRNIELNNKLVYKQRELNLCLINYSELKDKVALLEKEKKELMNELNVYLKKPQLHEELYETDRVYRGERVFYTKDRIYKYALPKIQDYFKCSEEMIKKEIQKAGITPDMTMLNKFRKASYYVAQNYTYMFDAHKFDVEENWEPVESLIVTKRGDCETMSMLVVMMCRASGIPSNRVFMADGLYVTPESEFGHAFPVLWAEDGKWYVGEPTNRRFTVQTWEKLRFKYVCLWGMGNDHFSVKIKGDKTFL